MTKLYVFFIISCLSSYFVYINTNHENIVMNNNSSYVLENEKIDEVKKDEEIEEKEEVIKSISIEKIPSKENTIRENSENELMNIEIPKINLIGNIYNKNSKLNNIDKNIIIMNESDYPDKESGIVIIGAHSGVGKYAYFKKLNNLEIGDYVYLMYNDNKYLYKVINYHLDSKDGFISISNVNNKNKLFLYTCNPNDKENYLVIECER